MSRSKPDHGFCELSLTDRKDGTISRHSLLGEVLLLSHRIRLGQPLPKLGVDVLDRGNDGVEERTDLGRLSREVMPEIVAPACVRLVAVRELAAASLAAPQRGGAQGMTRAESMPDDTPSEAAAPR
jgi:hypothetical protein